MPGTPFDLALPAEMGQPGRVGPAEAPVTLPGASLGLVASVSAVEPDPFGSGEVPMTMPAGPMGFTFPLTPPDPADSSDLGEVPATMPVTPGDIPFFVAAVEPDPADPTESDADEDMRTVPGRPFEWPAAAEAPRNPRTAPGATSADEAAARREAGAHQELDGDPGSGRSRPATVRTTHSTGAHSSRAHSSRARSSRARSGTSRSAAARSVGAGATSRRSAGGGASRSVGWQGRLAVRVGLVAWGVLVVGLWWFHTPGSSLRGGAALMTTFGRVSGLLAAYLMLVELVLMARIPLLERAVGLGRLAAWHRGLGTNIVVLMVSHVLLVVWGYGLEDHRQPVSELFTVITTYPEMWKATIGVLLFVTVGIVSARTLRRRISYELWYLLHLATYAAALLVYGHQVSTGAEFVNHPVSQQIWRAMYVTVFVCLIIGRVIRPLIVIARHPLRVERVVQESPGVTSVWLRGRKIDRLGATSGQFMRWRFLARGHWMSAHPYSLSAPPRPDRLRITVKAAGDHSAAITSLRPGTIVLAEGPFGQFTASRASRDKTLLVAGGGGIGPIRALAEELANRGDDVVVIHRVHTAQDLALWRELRRVAHKRQVIVHGVVGSRRELGYDPMAADRLVGLVPDVADRDVFICGPSGLTRTLVRSLRSLGLGDGQIHTEDFALRDARDDDARDARDDDARDARDDDARDARGGDAANSANSAANSANSAVGDARAPRAARDDGSRRSAEADGGVSNPDEDPPRREVAVPSAGLDTPGADAAS
jgi:predicted ferric reductase